MHAALAAELVRSAVASDEASMIVMRTEASSLAVTPVKIEPERCFRQQIGSGV